MTAPAIGVRQRWAANPNIAHVDWSHPLAQGLAFFAIGGVDIVTQQRLSNPPPLSTPTLVGPGYGGPSTTPPTLAIVGSPSARFSMFSVGSYDAASTYEASIGFYGSLSGAGLLFDRANGRLSLLFRAVAVYDIAFGLTRNQVYTTGVTCTGNSGTAVGYVDGARRTSLSVGTMTSVSNGSYYLLGADTSTNFAASTSRFSCGGIWTRVLSDSDMAQLHADPFCMLRS